MTNAHWKDVIGFEGLYQVSDLGRVRSLDRIDCRGHKLKGRVLRLRHNPNGYMTICLSTDGEQLLITVHKLVLGAFVGPRPEGHEACHNNGIRDDNRLENLRWDTRKCNAADRLKHGTDCRGSKTPISKLTDPQVAEIFVLRGQGWSLHEIGGRFGVHASTVSRVLNGCTWQYENDPQTQDCNQLHSVMETLT